METSSLEPPVPPDTDLSRLPAMMLNVDRLLNSELWILSTGDELKAALRLWCLAWKQVPAGSLPDDDRVLAGFSGAGRKWRKVREMALRGFVKYPDGRLYHNVLCEEVLRAVKSDLKKDNRRLTDAQRLRVWRARRRPNPELDSGSPENPEPSTIGNINKILAGEETETRFRNGGETTVKRVSYPFRNADETRLIESNIRKKEESPPLPPPQNAEGEGVNEVEGVTDDQAVEGGAETDELVEFEAFYRAYPRRKDRGHAEKAYAKARRQASAETLLEGAHRYAIEQASVEEKFIALPASWLNGKRWLDEPDKRRLRRNDTAWGGGIV